MVSIGWQGQRTTLAANYSRTVTGGGGLNGAFHATMVGASVNWRISRNWSTEVAANYSNHQTLTPLFLSSSGGRTLVGSVSAHRALGENLNLQFGYSWARQNYEQIAAVANAPNISRVFVSLNYQFSRALQK